MIKKNTDNMKVQTPALGSDKKKLTQSQSNNNQKNIISPDKPNPKNQSLVDPNSPMRKPQIKQANYQNDPDSPFRKKKEETEIKSNLITLQKIDDGSTTTQNHVYETLVKSLDNTTLIQKVGVKSKPGQTEKKIAKINQDSFINVQNFMDNNNIHLFGVCDGHGQFGHQSSQFIKANLPKKIQKHIQKKPSNTVNQILIDAFKETNAELVQSDINVDFSGSTTVLSLMIGPHIFTANLGDSRAIIAQKKGNGFTNKELSIDQKPELPKEKERIVKAGGRVEQYRDDREGFIGPYRVWYKYEQLPGLAMSRSFGDQIAAKVGVIDVPEIIYHQITKDDKFMVICSDGVWEFLENNDVTNMVSPFYQKNMPDQACEKLVNESVMWWKKEDEVVDDITAICIFLKD